ncbi:PadR family transcriptional regulator, partial [Frankia sp. AiPs1]|nr:PadR family transcriptional regulator [Frankia sp. AiPs1]
MTSQAIPGPWGPWGPWSKWGRAAGFDPARLSEFFETMAGWAEREAGGCEAKESAARDRTSRTARGGHGGGRHEHGGPGEGRP